jgi:hypothetical protein
VLRSNLSRNTGHADWSSSLFASVPPGKFRDSTSIRPQPLPNIFQFITIHLSCNTICTVSITKASLNNLRKKAQHQYVKQSHPHSKTGYYYEAPYFTGRTQNWIYWWPNTCCHARGEGTSACSPRGNSPVGPINGLTSRVGTAWIHPPTSGMYCSQGFSFFPLQIQPCILGTMRVFVNPCWLEPVTTLRYVTLWCMLTSIRAGWRRKLECCSS